MLLQGKNGQFRYLVGSSDGTQSLPAVAGAHLRQEWQEREDLLPMVAITDGAQKIRQDLATLLGRDIPLILDWYHLVLDWCHLAKRVYEHLSMIAHSRVERETLEHGLLGFLWQGQTEDARALLGGIRARNAKALPQ